MSLVSTLRQKVAPELNHLYTVPPFGADYGTDCGWYCREHALHTYFVAKLFGADVDIRRGDFLVCAPPYVEITSLDTSADHAWCRLNDTLPLDLSLTFRYFGKVPQLLGPIAGNGRNGPYSIVYSSDEAAARSADLGSIHFIERDVVSVSAEDLLLKPYSFLYPPLPSDPFSWDRLFGPEIYARISLHCFRVATREAKPLCRKCDSKAAVELIANAYPNAIEQLNELMGQRA